MPISENWAVVPFAVRFRLAALRPELRVKGTRLAARGAGMLFGLALLVLLGESYLQFFPPADIRKYLGDGAPGTGIYRPDAVLGADYRDFDSFVEENRPRIREFMPLSDANRERPIWAFFGSSFVQMQGMLGDTAKVGLPQKRIFHLGRNEPLHLRVAQVRLLLENGLKPERIVFALMPLDTAVYGQNTLDEIEVNARGVVTYRPPMPAKLSQTGSRLALAAWMRLVQPLPQVTTFARGLYTRVPDSLSSQTDRLFGELACVCARHGVPATVLLIPTHEQITRAFPHAFQDVVGDRCRAQGLDVCDVRDAFAPVADKAALFLPDKHFSAAGNAVLLSALVGHPGSRP